MTNDINEQIKLANKAIEQLKNQNSIFEKIIQTALENAPQEDKEKIQKLQMTSMKAINLAKSGKITEAEEIIKEFSNGKNN